jgi:hypothetical protein
MASKSVFGLAVLCAWSAAAIGPAQAASGPWVLSPRDASVYAGTEFQRIGHLALDNGSFTDEPVTVDSGISKFAVQGYVSYGIIPRVQIALSVPFQDVHANRTDGPVCTSFGLQACSRTTGFGLVDLRVQGLILDEFYGAPVSLAVGAELRQGAHTATERARITNLGEGTTDTGGYLSLGRTGPVGETGTWSGYVELGGVYRFPNILTDGAPTPGSEFTGDAEVLIGLSRAVSVGGTVAAFWRPFGVDISEVDLADIDRFSSLRVLSLRPGLKLMLRSSENVVFSASVLGTLYAENNPSDLLGVSAGMSVYLPGRDRGER